jgi:murein DD-endopeptidase MepM/ murein hydrolase activator NlpD
MMKINSTANRASPSQISAFSRWTRTLLSFCAIGLPLGAGLAMGYAIGHQPPNAVEDELGAALRERMRMVDPTRIQSPKVDALAGRMAELEAQVSHLDLRIDKGSPLSSVVITPKISYVPATGGPAIAEIFAPTLRDSGQHDIYQTIERLSRQIDGSEQQRESFDEWLMQRKTGEQALWSAQPVHRAGISSYFGMRVDPFTGQRAMHEGIDFSAKAGTAIMAAGDGIVSFAGEKQGYGRLVEIDHGDDCYSRYAHGKLVVVKAGDRVKKGQVIALMGSSGRSTGSHLHFEVYKHGRPVDPFVYIHQASR